jgi:hypothetical protein
MDSMFHEASARKRQRLRGKSVSIVDKEEEHFVQVTEEHWKNFTDILDVLQPLKNATEIMSGDSYPSLNMVIPAYVAIMDHLERLSSGTGTDEGSMYTESDFKIDASKAALMKLAKYYDISSELCTIATVLDPRLKLDFYRGDKNPSAENPAEIMSYVRSFYDRDYAPGGAKKPNILKRFYKKSTASDKSEIVVYLSEPVADDYPEFQVLDYWKINSARFPNLSRMARDYLAVPGTSTPSERAFSGGRQLITDFRCSLKGETITACMLLKDWRRQWDNVIQPQLDIISQ